MLISLIGYRGTGKTTIGNLLAEQLGWSCIDSDAFVEQESGVSIRQIFDTEGEEGFRQREARAIAQLTRRFKAVLALGGGAVLCETNRQAIRLAGPVVWLTAPAEELFRRISQDPASDGLRPNLTAAGGLDEVRQVLASRLPVYQECCDCQVSTEEKTPREIVDEIVQALGLKVTDSREPI